MTTFDIEKITPKMGEMVSYFYNTGDLILLNSSGGLEKVKNLYYQIKIPLEPFTSLWEGEDEMDETSFFIEWIQFFNENDINEPDWKKLVGKTFNLSYDKKTAEGSIYLMNIHNQFDGEITFTNLEGNIFDVELKVKVFFEKPIKYSNLDEDGFIKIKAQLKFDGLILYQDFLEISFEEIGKFVELNSYVDEIIWFGSENPNFEEYYKTMKDWKHLKPKY